MASPPDRPRDDRPSGASPERPVGAIRDEAPEPVSAADSPYWRANKRLVIGCLIVWALVSFGAGILFRPLLSGIEIGGTDLGFWFAQQGSIIVFIVLIFFYAARMNALDREHDVGE